MSLTRTKRVKHVGQDGAETFQEDNRWQFLNAEEFASAQVRDLHAACKHFHILSFF